MRQVFSKVTKATDRTVLYTRFGRQEYSSTSFYFFFLKKTFVRRTGTSHQQAYAQVGQLVASAQQSKVMLQK